MTHESKTTTDHDAIRRWVEARGGKPATVRGTERGEEAGILRVAFPGYEDPDDRDLEVISWDDFFEKFEEADLAFLYQEELEEGAPSRFFKFVRRK